MFLHGITAGLFFSGPARLEQIKDWPLVIRSGFYHPAFG